MSLSSKEGEKHLALRCCLAHSLRAPLAEGYKFRHNPEKQKTAEQSPKLFRTSCEGWSFMLHRKYLLSIDNVPPPLFYFLIKIEHL